MKTISMDIQGCMCCPYVEYDEVMCTASCSIAPEWINTKWAPNVIPQIAPDWCPLPDADEDDS